MPYKCVDEPEPKIQSNFDRYPDPHLTSSEGFLQCYNAQMAVDGDPDHRRDSGGKASDQGQLVGSLDGLETCGVEPAR